MNDASTSTQSLLGGARMRRALGEFAIIVCGVLAALAVNAGWQEHVDRARERQYLQQLLSDVRDNERRLQQALVLERGQMERASTVLTALRGTTPFPEDLATSSMMTEPTFPWFSDPRLLEGTIIALMETGDINLIRNDRVRVWTIRYQGQLRADLTEFGRKLEPFEELEVQLFRLLESARAADAKADSDDIARSLVALRNNAEAIALFRLFRMNIEARIWYLGQMLGATEGFLEVLQAEIET